MTLILYFPNDQSASQEALLYVCEDNEAVIKMIMKGRSPTMRHVSRTHRVALDWLFARINLDPQNPNQVHRHQKPTRRHFDKGEYHTVMNGIICWPCLISAIFSSIACIAAMEKTSSTRKSGEGRVTATSRPMMNLTGRTPSFVSSSASSNPGRTSYGYQDPGNLFQVTIDRGNLRNRPPPGYSKRGLWSILVFSRVEMWSCGARSIRETWENFLGNVAKSCSSSWGTSSRRKCAFCKVRRADSP